ncbi:MAG: DivIVA domain-containing protein [Bacteroidota bacterium]
MLQSRDIRNLRNQLKKRSLGGGYDIAEVDQNLSDLAQRWDDLSEELRMSHEKIAELEDKLKHYEKVELALQEALETARDTARRTEEAADRKAGLIVEEAELRAQRIIQEAEQERFGLRQDLSHLTNRQNEVAAKLRSFLMSELEMLAQFQGDDPVGFIKLVAPERSAEERTLPEPAAAIPSAVITEPESPTTENAADVSVAQDDEPDQDPAEAAGEKPVAMEELTAMEEPEPGEETPEAPQDLEARETTGVEVEADAITPESATEAEDAATIEANTTPEERPYIPRSPWPDVESPRIPASVWAPVPKANEPSPSPEGATPESDAPLGESPNESTAAPADSTPAAAPSWSSPGSFPTDANPEPPPSPGSEGGWSLRSLVTGDDDSQEAKDKHHEAVRRIMEDMD